MAPNNKNALDPSIIVMALTLFFLHEDILLMVVSWALLKPRTSNANTHGNLDGYFPDNLASHSDYKNALTLKLFVGRVFAYFQIHMFSLIKSPDISDIHLRRKTTDSSHHCQKKGS